MCGKFAMRGVFALLVAGLLNAGGCPTNTSACSGDPLAAVSAAQKFLNCGLLDITPCEMQAVIGVVNENNPAVTITVTEEQLQAAVDFLHANNLRCMSDLEALIRQAQQDPGSVVVPDSLHQLANSGLTLESIVQAK